MLPVRLAESDPSYRLPLGISAACGLANGLLIVLQAALLSRIISAVFLSHADMQAVWPQLLTLLAVFLGRAFSAGGEQVSGRAAAIRVKTHLRETLTSALAALGPAYAREERSGELTNTAVMGIEALDAFFSQYLPQLALAALIPLAILLFVFPLDTLTGVILVVTAPLIPLFMYLIGNLSESTTRRQWSVLSRLSAHFLDTLQGLTALKQMGRSREQARVIDRVSQRYRQATLGVLRVTFLSAFILELVATLSTAIVAVEIGLRLLAGQIDYPQALFILILAPEFYAPLRTLGARFHAGASGIAAARRIQAILDEPMPLPIVHPQAAPRVSRSIRCEGVSYTYPHAEAASLEEVTFEVQAGQRVALVGPSGAGKSTLFHLLLGFARPQAGCIRVDGVDLADVPPAAWREKVAWAPQNPYLFNDTLEANLRLARPGCTEAELRSAARAACLDEWVQTLPLGYQTRVGEQAMRLSGGEARRLALARAYLKDAPLLLLDEPAEALDVELEERLNQAIAQLSAGRTVLVIAHRLGTAERTDTVLVLERGRLVQAGPPAGLADRDGLYKTLLLASQGGATC